MDDALTIFIGSPSDVPEERKVVLEVSQDLDVRVARHLGLSVRALGFEHVLPGLGRPQDRINPEVDSCDVFVGIANLRWGTATGEYTSGFEEELERIKTRHMRGEAVVVLLYLRELNDESEAEPAMQAFREQIKTEALLRWFNNAEDFRRQLYYDLVQVVAERGGTNRRAVGAEAAEASSHTLPETPAHDALPVVGPAEPATAQAHAALSQFVAGDEDDASLVRAHLAVAARMSVRLTGATLDVHDVNRLYEYRGEIELDTDEAALVLRTAAAHGVTAPVWGLLAYDDEQALVRLLHLLLEDREAHIRTGVAEELGSAGINELVGSAVARGVPAEDLFRRLLSEGASGVRRIVIEAVRSSRREGAEGLLRDLLRDDVEPVVVFEQLGMLLVERNPDEALEHAATTPAWVNQEFLTALRAVADRLQLDGLVRMLEGSAAQKVLALKLLASRSDDLPDVQGLVEESSANVRRAAVEALTSRGIALDLERLDQALKDDSNTPVLRALTREGPTDEELRRTQFALLTPKARARHVSWTDLRGGDALAAAVVAGDAGAAELARDSLTDQLEHVREEHIATALKEGNEPMVRELAERYGNLMDTLWVQGALAGLADADAPEPGDAELAARHLGSLARREDAERLLARSGTAEHLAILIKAATDTVREESRGFLLDRALEVGGPERVLEELASTEDADTALRTLFKLAVKKGLEIPREALMPRLLNKNSGVRLGALRAIASGLEPKALALVLDDLASAPVRYYDVVGVLDRIVHGPEFAQARARAILEEA